MPSTTNIGPTVQQISPPTYWVGDVLETEEAVHGALLCAYQQGMDGLGPSIAAWMGLSPELYNLFHKDSKACARYLLDEYREREARGLAPRHGVWREDQCIRGQQALKPAIPIPQ